MDETILCPEMVFIKLLQRRDTSMDWGNREMRGVRADIGEWWVGLHSSRAFQNTDSNSRKKTEVNDTDKDDSIDSVLESMCPKLVEPYISLTFTKMSLRDRPHPPAAQVGSNQLKGDKT